MFDLKRFFAAVLCVCLLTACGDAKAPQSGEAQVLDKVDAPFTTSAKLRYGGVDATMDISKEEPRSYTIHFNEPSALKDLEMVFTEEKVNITFHGMKVSVKPEALTEGAVGNLLMDSIEHAAGKENLKIEKEGDALLIIGSSEGGDFELRLDGKTGNFASLSFPDSDFYMEFSGFSFY